MLNSRADRLVMTWTGLAGLIVFAFAVLAPTDAFAQSDRRGGGGAVLRDEPTAHRPTTEQHVDENGAPEFLQAVCWYIPNRIVDLLDIPRLYLTFGDGMGASLRITKYINATWFHDDAYGLGYSPRKPPFFGETVNERYFGFLAAQTGELDRDPSEIGLTFHFIAIGANAAVSLSETVDFVLGFLGIDLRADDHGPVLGADHTTDDETAGAPEEAPAATTAAAPAADEAKVAEPPAG
jgi:hypothetical protein